MIISLDKDYQSTLSFLPVWEVNDALLGVEVVAKFSSEGDIRIPTDLVIPRMSDDEQLRLFYEKLALLEQHRALFIHHGIVAWININALHVAAILHNEKLAARVAQLPFLEFAIRENYPDLNKGKNNLSLLTFSQRYRLVLKNFGAGVATTCAIFDRLFQRIIIDKFFIHKRIDEPSFEPFMKAIFDQVSPFCQTMIMAGIDSDSARQKAIKLRFHAMQGNLWPTVAPQALRFLLRNQQ